MDRDLKTLLPRVLELVQAAGREVMKFYASDRVEVRSKTDHSPLTEADCRSHEILKSGLAVLTPEIPVVSEEDAERLPAAQVGTGRFWLVDPLDGTKEFLKRTGEFTINVALISRREPALGVVQAPCLHRSYYGMPGQGAWRQDQAGVPRSIQTRRCDLNRLRLVASRDHAGPMVRRLNDRLRPESLVSMGSSLKFCLVAEGAADLYPRDVPTMEWDTAAAHAVLLAAGGQLLDDQGQPLRYGKPDFRNSAVYAVGDAKAAPGLLGPVLDAAGQASTHGRLANND